MKTLQGFCISTLLLVVLFLTGQSSAEEQKSYPATSAVVTNIAYFHMLDCYATANRSNPLNSLLRLSLDETLYASAKKSADKCVKDRKTTVAHNLTEVFFVSEITYNQLNAKARERHRQDADNFRNVNKMARIMHSAYYTDQFDLVFDKETVGEKADVGQALDGTFSFGCDMSVCKEDGKDKGVIVCHFVRGVPKPRRTITKAEADRRRAMEYGHSSTTREFELISFMCMLLSILQITRTLL